MSVFDQIKAHIVAIIFFIGLYLFWYTEHWDLGNTLMGIGFIYAFFYILIKTTGDIK